MAHSTIIFKHPSFGSIKKAPVGFSWTTCLFGFWPALFRGDLKWAAIQFGVAVVASIPTLGVGAIVVAIAFGFVYNKLYVKELVAKGYKVDSIKSSFSLEQLQSKVEVVLAAQ